MAIFKRGTRTADEFDPGVPGLVVEMDHGFRLLCVADKHPLADLFFDGTLRIWDKRCKRPFTFDLTGLMSVDKPGRLG